MAMITAMITVATMVANSVIGVGPALSHSKRTPALAKPFTVRSREVRSAKEISVPAVYSGGGAVSSPVYIFLGDFRV